MPPPDRMTVIPGDRTVALDGDHRTVTEVRSLHPDIHAIQWYGEEGEIEWKDPDAPPGLIRLVRNERITSIASFQTVIDAHATAQK